jgi:DNA primase
VQWCRLNSFTDPQGTSWLQIPYFDANAQLTGIQNRRLAWNPAKGTPPRFLFPKGSRCSIYNLPILACLGDGDQLWITEGSSDCWAMLSTGRKAIAIPSATLLRSCADEHIEILRHHPHLHIYPDADLPGENLYLQLKQQLPQLIKHTLPSGCKDFSDYYKQSKMGSEI